MIEIRKYDISITRGDAAYITFDLRTANGQTAVLTQYDIVRCQVRDRKVDGELMFEGQVERDGNQFIWHIRPENTAGLEFGEYYWDAQVEYINGDIFTFIPVSRFVVLPEITLENS